MEEMDLERAHLGDQDVDSHVPLRASDQSRVAYVLLNHALLVILQVLEVVDDSDLSATRQVRRFTDPHLFLLRGAEGLARVHVRELFRLVRQAVGRRCEVVNFAEPALVSLDEPRQVVLRAQDTRLGEVDQPLVRLAS